MALGIVIVLFIINIPLYKFLAQLIFTDNEEMREAVKYTFTPDIFSLFKGRYFTDIFCEIKLFFFCFCCAAVVAGEFFLIQKVLNLIGIFL